MNCFSSHFILILLSFLFYYRNVIGFYVIMEGLKRLNVNKFLFVSNNKEVVFSYLYYPKLQIDKLI